MASAETRQRYADEIRENAQIRSTALMQVVAKVPREEFVGRGPWNILSRPAAGYSSPQVVEMADPAELHRHVAVLLDRSPDLTNGNPGTLGLGLGALNLCQGKAVFHPGAITVAGSAFFRTELLAARL